MATKASIRRQWKRIEQKVADFLGGKRIPITGRTRGETPDIEHAFLLPEVKYKQKFPGWLWEAMQQAEAAKKNYPRRMPCVILVEKGQNIGDGLICFRLSDARDQWIA